MEKIVHLTEKEYADLLSKCPIEKKNIVELTFWEDSKYGHSKTTLLTSYTEDVLQYVENIVDMWNNRQEYVDRIYSRNLWERIINKKVER